MTLAQSLQDITDYYKTRRHPAFISRQKNYAAQLGLL